MGLPPLPADRDDGASEPPPVEASIFFKLVRVVNLTARPFVEGIGRDENLALAQWRVMVVLAAHPGWSAQDVVARSGLDKMTVSRAIAGLSRHGYLLRKADPADRRRTALRLSASGRRAYERIAVSGRQREATLFSGISESERAQLARMLDKLAANLGE